MKEYYSEECWIKTVNLNIWGYSVAAQNGNKRAGHRVAYEVLVGPIPEGLELDHLCRNRACYNPAHLEPVTRKENARRGSNCGKGKCRKCGMDKVGHNLQKVGEKERCRSCNVSGLRNRRRLSSFKKHGKELRNGTDTCKKCSSSMLGDNVYTRFDTKLGRQVRRCRACSEAYRQKKKGALSSDI